MCLKYMATLVYLEVITYIFCMKKKTMIITEKINNILFSVMKSGLNIKRFYLHSDNPI